MLFKAVCQGFIIRGRGGGLIKNDDVISGQRCAMLAKRLTYQSFQAVAAGGELAMLLANDEPEPGAGARVFTVENSKHFVAAALSLLEYAAVVGTFGQTIVAAEATVLRRHFWLLRGYIVGFAREWQKLGRETGATFGASSFQHQTTGFGCHPCSKTVRAGSFDFAWLKCAFHLTATWRCRFARSRRSSNQTDKPVAYHEKAGKVTWGVHFCQ